MHNSQQQNHIQPKMNTQLTQFQSNNYISLNNNNRYQQFHNLYQYPQNSSCNPYVYRNNTYTQGFNYEQSDNQKNGKQYNQQQIFRNWRNFNNPSNYEFNQYKNRRQLSHNYNNEQYGQQRQQQTSINNYYHSYYHPYDIQQCQQYQNQQQTQFNNYRGYFQGSYAPSTHKNINVITTDSNLQSKTNESSYEGKRKSQQDPRIKFKKSKHSQEQNKQSNKYITTSHQYQSKKSQNQSNSDKSSLSEDEEELYQKTKIITKKRDPILDAPQEIRKWVMLRKKNYPHSNRVKTDNQKALQEMSMLELKIRKKIMFLTADGRGLAKKMKNMHILRRLISEQKIQGPKRRKREIKERAEQIRRIKQSKEFNDLNIENLQNGQQKNIKKYKKQYEDSPESEKSNEQAIQLPINRQTLLNSAMNSNIQEKQLNSDQLEVINCHKTQKFLGLTPQDMIKHLRQKQSEDQQFYNQLFNYPTNSLNYKYNSLTLETNFLLEDIFQESSYLLQIIRYIVKNNFFYAQ